MSYCNLFKYSFLFYKKQITSLTNIEFDSIYECILKSQQ